MANKQANKGALVVLGCLTALASAEVQAAESVEENAEPTRALGVAEAALSFGHDGLAGRLAHQRRSGAELGLSVMARPHAWRAGTLFEHFSFGVGAELGWSARVPTDAAASVLQPYDVAPNGYLHGGLRFELLGDSDRLTLRYTIGATGDKSHADLLYGTLGDLGGWDHAAEGEIAQNIWLSWQHVWLEAMATSAGTHLVDVASEATTALGERRVSQTLALTTRAGWLLGPLDATRNSPDESWSGNVEAYVHATVGIDLVAHDAMIDSPLFNDRPHPYEVSAKAFVPYATVGVMLRPWRHVGLGYALEIRGADSCFEPTSTSSSPPTTCSRSPA